MHASLHNRLWHDNNSLVFQQLIASPPLSVRKYNFIVKKYTVIHYIDLWEQIRNLGGGERRRGRDWKGSEGGDGVHGDCKN